MKYLIRSIMYQTMRKYIDENKLNIRQMSIRKEDIFFFSLSSNPIISFCLNGKIYYFRECKKILPEKQYIENVIYEFFYFLDRLPIKMQSFQQEFPINLSFSNSAVLSFRGYIQHCIARPCFVKNMLRTDLISEKNGFSIWANQKYAKDFFEQYGLSALPETLWDIGIYFLWYMRSAAITYRTLRIVRGKKYSFFNAVKSIASRIVAEELDVESLITTAQWCRLEIEGRESIFGVLSDAAPGIRMCDGGWVKEGSLQRSLMNLNILDIICYQPDHGPNNYTVITEAVGRGMICAFDNDNPYTFFPCPIVSMSLVNCSSFVTKDGMIFRPYIDEIMAQKVLELDIKVLKKRLRDYLNILQIWALMLRVKQLENIIRKTRIQKPDCFLSPSDWNEYTIEKELNGNYGETYLTKALNRK